MAKLRVVDRAIADLEPNPHNPRAHSARQVDQIAASIRAFGFTLPILVDENARVLAGHARLDAAKRLGLKTVPTISIGHLSEAQKRAYAIADNRLAELATWDKEQLALTFKTLLEFDLDFDIAVTGFDIEEIDLFVEGLDTGAEDPAADALPEHDPRTLPVSRPGDLWALGPHRLFCGDATKEESFTRLMGRRRARMVFVDPPYNVRIAGHVSGLGRIKHREFPMASGEMSEAEYTAFLEKAFRQLVRHSCAGSIHYVCIDWRHLAEILAAGRAADAELINLCVWVKTNAGMGSLYRSQHELVFVFKSGKGRHANNVRLGRFGRNRSNVWTYAGANTLGPERLEQLAMHPTVKPAALVADALLDCSRKGDLVLDSFAGSGTTVIAAEKTGRLAYAIELDPRYVDTAVRRWETFTGHAAVHAETGQTFAETAAQRSDDGKRPIRGSRPRPRLRASAKRGASYVR